MKLNPFASETPITYVAPGYQPDLDRLPPSEGAGCFKLIMLIVIFVAVLGLAGFTVYGYVSHNTGEPPTETVIPTLEIHTFSPLERIEYVTLTPSETFTPTPTETATNTATPDAWSQTGTALYVATNTLTPTPTETRDYCDWLTPTGTFTPTFAYTPDMWGRTGTAVFYRTQTATPVQSPTPTAPRAWCDYTPPPTRTLIHTRTATPPRVEYLVSPTFAPTNTRIRYTHIPDLNATYGYPVAPVDSGQGQDVIIQVVTVIVQYTMPPLGTLPPAFTPFPTLLPTLAVNTPESTENVVGPSYTPTMTATATYTATHTDTATATATNTPTYTATATDTATPTDTPTLEVITP